MGKSEHHLLVSLLFAATTVCEVIPRDLIFSSPEYSEVSLSPDGNTVGYLAHDKNDFQWTGVPNIIIFYVDNNGDENYRLYKLNITERDPPHKPYAICDKIGVKALIVANDKRHHKILVGLNDDGLIFHDIYEFDLLTDRMKIIMHNKRFAQPIYIDNDLQIRLAYQEKADGSTEYYRVSESADPRNLTSDESDWVLYLTVPQRDTLLTKPVGFSGDNKRVFWLWGMDTDLGQLVVHDFGHPEANEIIYTAKKAEIEYKYEEDIDDNDIFVHPIDKTILAITEVQSFYHKPEIYVLNDTVKDDLEYLNNLHPNDSPIIVGISQDFRTWLITYLSDRIPYEFYFYRRPLKKAEFLFTTRPKLKGKKLCRMVGFEFVTRDNLTLQAYLSLPPNTELRKPSELKDPVQAAYAAKGLLPRRPQKMVVDVHGGPQHRERFGYTKRNVWLTSRGYAVLQVNFRGSRGFGKKLLNAGNGEWGRKMHYDLIDGVNFAIKNGIAKRSQIAIMGGSYGGYAALIGMTFTPNVFACGVDVVGPSNLITLLEAVPPYWLVIYNRITLMLGADKNTTEGRAFLRSRSPLFFADRVRKPLMILQGANDPRVARNESDQFVAALKANNIPVTYILYPDEGHGFRKPENALAQAGFVEKFLHGCIHGEYEEFNLRQHNSSAMVLSDAEGLYGTVEPDELGVLGDTPFTAPEIEGENDFRDTQSG
uniref:Peptidase S9 prolyl oligopeptidase catalytic domain-containing protein n=1 Tax=Ascaris lumbricoides TaxID=6252 RepID=A0A9J2P590_ASCLU